MARTWSTTLTEARASAGGRRLRRSTLAGTLAVAVVLGGGAQAGVASPSPAVEETSSVVVPAEPITVEAVPDEHLAAIRSYFEERDAAFARGADAGVSFVASRLHPGLGYSEDQCRRAWFPEGVPDQLRQATTIQEDTVVAASDWRMPHGPLHDMEIASPVYRAHVQTVLTGLASGVDVDRTVAVHLSIVGGQAYGFGTCVEPTVARTLITRLTTTTAVQEPAPVPQSDPAPAPTGSAPPAGDPVEPTPWAPEPAPSQPAPTQPAPSQPPPSQPRPGPVPETPEEPTIPAPPAPEEELTLDEELDLLLATIDGLLHAGLLSVDEAIEVLVELADAPELEDHHRQLVEANLRLLWDYQDKPEGELPRLIRELDDTADTDREPLDDCDVVLELLGGHVSCD